MMGSANLLLGSGVRAVLHAVAEELQHTPPAAGPAAATRIRAFELVYKHGNAAGKSTTGNRHGMALSLALCRTTSIIGWQEVPGF
jgi:hypothetical protein